MLLSTFSHHVFSAAGPMVWNMLHDDLQNLTRSVLRGSQTVQWCTI